MSRRPRSSLTSPPPIGADDISHLSLPEIQERLARNARVLGTSLFSPPSLPTSPAATPPPPPGGSPADLSIQPQSTAGGMTSSPVPIAIAQNGRMNHGRLNRNIRSAGTSPTEPVRDRLMRVREQLLERERELMMVQTEQEMGGLQLGTTGDAAAAVSGIPDVGGGEDEEMGNGAAESSAMAGRRWSADDPKSSSRGFAAKRQGESSGKRAAMRNITEREKGYASNGIILPISDSLALASREYDHLTASRLSALSLDMGTVPRGSSSPKSRRLKTLYPEDPPHTPSSSSSRLLAGGDEIARAEALARQRMGAFMSYKDQDFSDSDDADEDHGDGMFEVEEEEDYPGSSRPDDVPFGGRRGEGTGERVDEMGEDDERFAEGNSDDEADAGNGDEGVRPSEGLEERMVVG